MTHTAPTPHPYNGIAIQRAAILARLQQGPAKGAQLQTECNAPDPTARVYELRCEGHQIETRWIDQVNPDGTVNRVALYVLLVKDDRQGPDGQSKFPHLWPPQIPPGRTDRIMTIPG